MNTQIPAEKIRNTRLAERVIDSNMHRGEENLHFFVLGDENVKNSKMQILPIHSNQKWILANEGRYHRTLTNKTQTKIC